MDIALAMQVDEAMRLGLDAEEARRIFEAAASGGLEEADEVVEEIDDDRVARMNARAMGEIDAALGR